MNKKQKIFASIILLTIGLLIWFVFFGGTSAEAYIIKPQNAFKGITVTGRIKSSEDAMVAPDVVGIIEKIYVKEGDYVKKGQIIATMTRDEQVGGLESAQANLRIAEWGLKDLLTEPRKQEVEIAKDRIEYSKHKIELLEHSFERYKVDLEDAKLEQKRYKTLEEAGAVSKRELEQRTLRERELENTLGETKAQINQTEHELEDAKLNLSLTINKIKNEKINIAKSQIDSAAGGVISAKSRLDDYVIKAPISGILVDKLLHTGDISSPSSPIARIVIPKFMYLSMDVEETEMDKVKKGQKAFVIFDAYPDKVFESYVNRIVKQVDPLTGTFEAIINIPEEKIRLLVGMTLDATIIFNEYKNILIAPNDFIVQEDGNSYVFKKFLNFAVKTPVETEMFDNNRSKIIKGLQKDDIILKSTGELRNKLKNNSNIKITEYIK